MRKGLSIAVIIILLFTLLIAGGILQSKRILSDFHIENLTYDLQKINLYSIHFSELNFVYTAENFPQAIRIRDIAIAWHWQRFSPYLDKLNIEHVDIKGLDDNAAPKQEQTPTKNPLSLPKQWHIPEKFPQNINIQAFVITRPCAAGLCSFAGKFGADLVAADKIKFTFQASPGNVLNQQHQLILDANYSLEKNLPIITASLQIDKNILVQVNSTLEQKNEIYWTGKVNIKATDLDQWWSTYLTAWNIRLDPIAKEPSGLTAEKLHLNTGWKLALDPLLKLPADAELSQWVKALTGSWILDVQIPEPIHLINRGEFSGKGKMDVDITAGQLNHYELALHLNAEHLILPDSWQFLDVPINNMQLNVQSKVIDVVSLSALPITFSAATQGALESIVSGNILADTLTKKLTLEQLALMIKAKKLKPREDVALENINVDVHANGYWQNDTFALRLSAPSQLSADINAPALSLSAKSAHFSAKQLNVMGKLDQGNIVLPQLHIESDSVLNIDKLYFPQLKPTAWLWRGKILGTPENFDIKGDLVVGNGLNINHHGIGATEKFTLDWTMPDLFLLAANPFADALKAWPPLLSLARGKIKANGSLLFDMNKSSLTQSKTYIQLQDIAGIYDTIAFEGINTNLNLLANQKMIQVATDALNINQINKGFIFGPLTTAGIYKAGWDKPLQGKLLLEHFKCVAMEGIITTPKQEFDFSRSNQHFMLSLDKLNLSTLLQQHSPSELSGSGQISGDIPFEINAKGIRVAKGMVSAVPPGGLLKYQSARAAELAKTQPSMKLITEALSDFHYSILASEVNYDESGKLLLSVRLEGKNPQLEKGRPIHLNVSLEEDIPAMLASIQLSSKVTDVIKKRVQEYIQKKPAATTVP